MKQIESDRLAALRGTDIVQMVGRLELLHSAFQNLDSERPLDDLVAMTIQHTVGDIIERLRDLTGEDYGDDPTVWIEILRPASPRTVTKDE